MRRGSTPSTSSSSSRSARRPDRFSTLTDNSVVRSETVPHLLRMSGAGEKISPDGTPDVERQNVRVSAPQVDGWIRSTHPPSTGMVIGEGLWARRERGCHRVIGTFASAPLSFSSENRSCGWMVGSSWGGTVQRSRQADEVRSTVVCWPAEEMRR
ncbi:hypothetical protein VTN02DRAFT_3568 [Thermoascus thermophilus]